MAILTHTAGVVCFPGTDTPTGLHNTIQGCSKATLSDTQKRGRRCGEGSGRRRRRAPEREASLTSSIIPQGRERVKRAAPVNRCVRIGCEAVSAP